MFGVDSIIEVYTALESCNSVMFAHTFIGKKITNTVSMVLS